MLAQILIALGLLFLLFLILAPLIYYFNKEKEDEKEEDADEGKDLLAEDEAEADE